MKKATKKRAAPKARPAVQPVSGDLVYAAFLAFARAHLVRPRGASRLTPSDLRVLDLLPSTAYE